MITHKLNEFDVGSLFFYGDSFVYVGSKCVVYGGLVDGDRLFAFEAGEIE